ncbi:MAG: hypothetical protein UW70_C0075G0003 [Candidatus Peregrinibacteria bacterium GW2011_GWA2_44_7]|nr:MAG: hypothetical protein UW70_C0075G0003 [Candidatus Peregrinibacteria bacterium GW2011_GWA2_44_7]
MTISFLGILGIIALGAILLFIFGFLLLGFYEEKHTQKKSKEKP